MVEPPDPGGMMIEDDVVAEGQNSNFDPNQGEAAVPASATAGVVYAVQGGVALPARYDRKV